MKLGEVLQKTIQFFKTKNFQSPRLDAELLVAHALKIERIQLYVKYDQPLIENEIVACREVVKRRSQGEPVAYICGQKDFFGLSFKVTKDVLIPRPETEHLVENAIEWANKNISLNSKINIIDLGTGSGCIAIALAKKLVNSRVLAVEQSEPALNIARQNAILNGVEERIEFIQDDCFLAEANPQFQDFFKGVSRAQIVLGNPPYISFDDKLVDEAVRKFEPRDALFSKEQGFQHLKGWFDVFYKILDRSSFFAFEVGIGQAEVVKKFFESSNKFDEIFVVNDLSGIQRIVVGVCNG